MARSQNKGLSEHQRRPSRLLTGPSPALEGEAGGGQPEPEGEGQSRPQRRHPPSNCEQAPSDEPRLPEILDSWHPPGGSQPETSSPEDTHTVQLRWRSHRTPRKPRGWPGRWTGAPPGWRSECAKHLASWAAQTWEGLETQAQSLCLRAVPGNLNLSGLDLGSTRRATWSLSE